MDPQTAIITLDVILSLVPQAKALTRSDIARGEYPNPVTNSDFFAIERNGEHLVFWLDGDNNAHRIARCRDNGRAAFIIWYMTQLVTAKIVRATTEPVADVAPVADESEISLPIPSGSPLRKQILFDRKTDDFAMYFEGELVGYAPSYLEANSRLNKLAYEALRRAA